MRSNRGIFWYSLGLTLLLLLPMVLTVAFFTDQYQKQQLLRQASAADSTLRIEPGAQGVYTLLLVVQQEEPAFVLARADGPQQAVTLCALPGFAARQRALRAQQRWRSVRCAAGAGRAAQLLVRHGGYGGDRRARRCTISRPRPPPGRPARAAQPRRGIDTAALLDARRTARAWATARIPSPCVPPRRQAELIAKLQAALPGAGEGRMARAAVWAGLCLRQDPALLAASARPGCAASSARLLTDLLAADLSALERYADLPQYPPRAWRWITPTAETAKAKGGV